MTIVYDEVTEDDFSKNAEDDEKIIEKLEESPDEILDFTTTCSTTTRTFSSTTRTSTSYASTTTTTTTTEVSNLSVSFQQL